MLSRKYQGKEEQLDFSFEFLLFHIFIICLIIVYQMLLSEKKDIFYLFCFTTILLLV